MSRYFDEPVRANVFVRQRGMCAFCGMSLNELLEETAMDWIEFHHLMPPRLGGRNDADNCVALCTYTSAKDKTKDGCHYHVHQRGRFAGAVAGPRDFKFSHAHEQAARDAWILRWIKTYGLFG